MVGGVAGCKNGGQSHAGGSDGRSVSQVLGMGESRPGISRDRRAGQLAQSLGPGIMVGVTVGHQDGFQVTTLPVYGPGQGLNVPGHIRAGVNHDKIRAAPDNIAVGAGQSHRAGVGSP